MTLTRFAARFLSATLHGTLGATVFITAMAALVSPSTASAAAIPEPGDPVRPAVTVTDPACHLQRVGSHLVRCDFLTGSTTALGGPTPAVSDPAACPLRRVGRHLVRCDFLTGHGDAPAFIIEL